MVWGKALLYEKLQDRYSHSFPSSLSNAVLFVVSAFLLSHVSVWGFPSLQAKTRLRECWGAYKNIAFDQLGNSPIRNYKWSPTQVAWITRSSPLQNLLRHLHISHTFSNVSIHRFWSIQFGILPFDLAANWELGDQHSFQSPLTLKIHISCFTVVASFVPWRDPGFVSCKAKL